MHLPAFLHLAGDGQFLHSLNTGAFLTTPPLFILVLVPLQAHFFLPHFLQAMLFLSCFGVTRETAISLLR